MKRFLLILLFMMITGAEAQDFISIPIEEGFISSWRMNSTGTRMFLYTTDSRDCQYVRCVVELRLIDLIDGRVILQMDASGMSNITMSNDGERFSIGWNEGEGADSAYILEIRSMLDGSILDTNRFPDAEFESDSIDSIRSYFHFSPDLQTAVRLITRAAEGAYYGDIVEVSAWNLEDDTLLYNESCENSLYIEFESAELISPNGEYVLGGCAEHEVNGDSVLGQMKIIELATGEVIQEIPRFSKTDSFYWSDNNQHLVTYDSETLRLYNLEGEVAHYDVQSAGNLFDGFSADGNYYILDSSESIHIIKLNTGETTVLNVESFGGTYFPTIQISPDGSRIFFVVDNYLEDEIISMYVMDLATQEIVNELVITEPFARNFLAGFFFQHWNPDGSAITFCAGELNVTESAVVYWELESNSYSKLDVYESGEYINHCEFRYNSNGRYLAIHRNLPDSSPIVVYDLESLEMVYEVSYLSVAMSWQAETDNLVFITFTEPRIEVHELP